MESGRGASALIALAASLALGACGDPSSAPLPKVVPHGGPVLNEVDVVTITYAGDPWADYDERLDRDLVSSSWLGEVGREYDVRGGAQLATYRIPQAAPALLSYDDVDAIAPSLLAQQLVPGPTHDGTPVLYMIHVPAGTAIGDPNSAQDRSCIAWLAYHASHQQIPYAVLPQCFPPGAIAETDIGASHELIEAATDPFGDGWTMDPVYTDPNGFTTYVPGEVGDLCVRDAIVRDGHVLAKVWSAASLTTDDPRPCRPLTDDQPYRTVLADEIVKFAEPGEQVTWDLTGWSSGPTDDWPLVARHGYDLGPGIADNDLLVGAAHLSSPTINAGQRVTLTLTVPADYVPGGSINVWSGTAWTPLVLL